MNENLLKIICIYLLSLAFLGLNAQNSIIVTDIDGYVYKTVTLGSQVWMAENLSTTKLNDGSLISLDIVGCVSDKNTYSFYDNNKPLYAETYGALYNWSTVESGKLCPVGWRVPSGSDWKTLKTYIESGNISGKELLELGFTMPLAGEYFCDEEEGYSGFIGKGKYDSWWSNSKSNDNFPIYYKIYNADGEIDVNVPFYSDSHSVRCVKNLH